MGRPRRPRKFLLCIGIFLMSALGAFFFILPVVAERKINATVRRGPYHASEKALALHHKLFIADLHADSLLWGRNLLNRGTRGHVDIPRLIEGNVALQAFTIVTKAPRGLNIERNDDRTDNIIFAALAQRWPRATWGSLKERALYQANRLADTAARSNDKFVLIKSAADLLTYLDRRKREPAITAGFLGIEGAHALEGSLDNVDVLFDAGIRMMSPTHFFDNQVAGSAHGLKKGGLTEFGREVIKRMETKHMLVDVSHASPKTIDDVLDLVTKPVVASHTGVKGTCDNNRNLSDDHIKGIAKTGGVIGIGFWETAVCGQDPAAIVRAIRYVVNLVGISYVGLGSDFDGAISAPFDATGLVLITDALLADGFSEPEIENIMGGNVLRVLAANLP